MSLLWKLFELPRKMHWHLKRAHLKGRFKQLGSNLVFDPEGAQYSPETMTIGNNVFIGHGAIMVGHVHLKNNIMFGPRPTLIGGTHLFSRKGQSVRFIEPKDSENAQPIHIEDDVWCGANVTIVGNVTVGMGAVVGAGSVVVKDIPPFVLAAGNPCLAKRQIFSDEDLKVHLQGLGVSADEIGRIITSRRDSLHNQKLENLPLYTP